MRIKAIQKAKKQSREESRGYEKRGASNRWLWNDEGVQNWGITYTVRNGVLHEGGGFPLVEGRESTVCAQQSLFVSRFLRWSNRAIALEKEHNETTFNFL